MKLSMDRKERPMLPLLVASVSDWQRHLSRGSTDCEPGTQPGQSSHTAEGHHCSIVKPVSKEVSRKLWSRGRPGYSWDWGAINYNIVWWNKQTFIVTWSMAGWTLAKSWNSGCFDPFDLLPMHKKLLTYFAKSCIDHSQVVLSATWQATHTVISILLPGN